MDGDLSGLYRAVAPRLERIVSRQVRAPRPVIEDACQTSWCRLVRDASQLNEGGAVQWLVTTAVREARRLSSRDRRELSLDSQLDRDGELNVVAADPTPHELAVLHERLGLLNHLAPRQRQLLWLHAVGLSYHEIAATQAGLTTRTVERQLYHGRRRLRLAA